MLKKKNNIKSKYKLEFVFKNIVQEIVMLFTEKVRESKNMILTHQAQVKGLYIYDLPY